MRRGVLLLALPLFALAPAGCARTGATTRTDDPVRGTPRVGECHPRGRVIAPAPRLAGAAAAVYDGTGIAVAWTEKVGAREAVFFHPFGGDGAPRGPITEIVDREGPLTDLSFDFDAKGYEVSWAEGSARLARRLDLRGRPSSDVTPSKRAPVSTLSRCATVGDHVVCKSEQGTTLALSPGERVLAEIAGRSGAEAITVGPGGLRYVFLACAKE